MDILHRVLSGEPRAIARLLSRVEDERGPQIESLLAQLFAEAAGAAVMGITGSPGVGKSTLVDRLAHHYLKLKEKVGILAVDPTSPFSGGALLGDRIRMRSVSLQPGVFIRSMATRGKLGGLAPAVSDALLVLSAAGYKRLIVETVGTGQDEVDVARSAQVTLVVLAPGMGDEIQAIKAGIMEIADIFVVNKADREGADRAVRDLEMLAADHEAYRGWTPLVVKTTAATGEGIEALVDAVEDFRSFLLRSELGFHRMVQMERQKLVQLIEDRVLRETRSLISEEDLTAWSERVARGQAHPFEAADDLLRRVERIQVSELRRREEKVP